MLNDESKRETPCMVNFGEKQVRDDERRRDETRGDDDDDGWDEMR